MYPGEDQGGDQEAHFDLQDRYGYCAGAGNVRQERSLKVEVPPGVSQELHSHEEAEQVYVVVGGTGTRSAAGDTETLEPGDLALIPPASDHTIANQGDGPLALVSVQSPAVSVEETFGRQLAEVAGYEDEDEY